MSFSNFIPVQPKKCQCISLNSNGYILESDNALFNAGILMGKPLTAGVPFIKKIFSKLKKMHQGDEPLFFPNIKLDVSNYHSVCDFIFTKIESEDGDSILCFIYDNSIHYNALLASASGNKGGNSSDKDSQLPGFFE